MAQRKAMEWLCLRGRNQKYALIIGTNERAMQFAESIQSQQILGYHIVGFVDDYWGGLNSFQNTSQSKLDLPYDLVADFDGFREFIRKNVVDEVFIFLPVASYYNHISQIVAHCEEQGVMVRMSSSILNLNLGQATVDEFQEQHLVTISTGAMRGWSLLFKRVFDQVAATLIVILLSPVMLLTALMVKITSPGPILFKQERVGLNKRKIYVYKFRSMVVDAEKRLAELEELNEVSGPVFKITKDPRITPIGEFIRKTSLDELPQLFNVIMGDMSLVGPRPLPVRDYSGFDKDWHRRRITVRPGITCLWQVQGRSSIPFEKWMELDMQYIDEWSLSLDMIILFKTIPAVIRGSGAA
jgi:exopolysaccharide biosynthesis polyprenyl glycosylphosphotransferase